MRKSCTVQEEEIGCADKNLEELASKIGFELLGDIDDQELGARGRRSAERGSRG